MQVIYEDPVKRHASAAFNYRRLFDGRSWLLEPEDLGHRTQAQAAELIRQAAWRYAVKVTIEMSGENLIVKAEKQA